MALAHKGMNYDVGTDYLGQLSLQVWRHEFVRREILAIRDELNCNAVCVFGTDIGRLAECSRMALESGLRVMIQPRLFDSDVDDYLDHLSEAARVAELLRMEFADLLLNVGCELSIFENGIIPGRNFEQRLARFPFLWPLMPLYNRRLDRLLRRAIEVARADFAGDITYSSGDWETVDWSMFDLVGVNYYKHSWNASKYVSGLSRYQRHGKPVIITEFGCCSYDGAAEKGPSGYEIADERTCQIKGDYVRNEQVQADYITELLRIYADEDVHGAYVWGFMESGFPHSPDPRRDLDMASFGVVKVFPCDSDKAYETTGYWERKPAYHAISRFFAESP